MYKVIFFDLGNTLVSSETFEWLPGAKDGLRALHEAGAQLGVISNTGAMKLEALQSVLPTDFPWELFAPHLLVLSAETPWTKPDKKIFQHAVELAAQEAGGCLYCSEDLTETFVAQSVGLHALRVLPGELPASLEILRTSIAV